MTNHYQLSTEQQKKLEAKQQELMVEVRAKRMTPDQASQQLAVIVNPQFSSKLLESPTQTPQGLMGQGGGMPASEVQARDAQIMSPGYNNQGVQGFKPQVSAEVQGTQGLMGRPPTPQTPPFQPGGNAFPMTREHVQPQAPQQMPEQSIFGRMGDGLKSMGQGISGYTGKLFNDPNRMALLQGGLSMMDPNSYYDKQGFGSVFTGLNKGLGAAQGGMQGVLGRRKSRADIEKTRAEGEYARGGKKGEKSAEFSRLLARYNDPATPQAEKEAIGGRLKVLKGETGVDYENRYMQQYIHEKKLPEAELLQSTLNDFVQTMAETVDTDLGIRTGTGADVLTSIGQFLKERMGQDLGEGADLVSNTKLYMSKMGTQVGQIIKQFGSGTGLSDADREFASMIAAQDPSKFDQDSLRRVLAINEARMRYDLDKANTKITEMYPNGSPPAYMLQEMPPMSKNLKNKIKKDIAAGKYKVKGKKDTKRPIGWEDSYEGEWEDLATGKSGGEFSGFSVVP